MCSADSRWVGLSSISVVARQAVEVWGSDVAGRAQAFEQGDVEVLLDVQRDAEQRACRLPSRSGCCPGRRW